MDDHHFRQLELHLSFDELHRLPPNSVCRHELFGGW
jgi:hypothetical protein